MKKNIVDLLEHYTEEPSGRCWDSISKQLQASSSSSTSGNSGGDPSTFSAIKEALFQKSSIFWIKTAIVAVTTATVITVGVTAIFQNSKTPSLSSDPHQSTSSEFAMTESPLADETSITSPDEEIASSPEKIIISEQPNRKEQVDTSKLEDNTSILQNEPITSSSNITPHISDQTPTPEPAQNSNEIPDVQTYADHQTPSAEETTQTKDPVIENSGETVESLFSVPVKIMIPNIITPNGDGLNDYFEIEGIELIENNKLTIRNRQGRIIYNTSSYKNNWGNDIAPGTYFYLFEYSINGIEEYRKGSLSVIK